MTAVRWSDFPQSRACLRSKRRRPSEDAIGHQAPSRFVPETGEHNPYVGVSVIDAAVAYGFPVVGFLPSRHQNQLQFDPIRFLEHGVGANLDGGSKVEVRLVRRNLGIQEPRSGYAVCDLRLAQGSNWYALAYALVACPGGQAIATIRRPSHPAKWLKRFNAGDMPLLRAAQCQHRVKTPKAIAQEHYVLHRRKHSRATCNTAPSNNALNLPKRDVLSLGRHH